MGVQPFELCLEIRKWQCHRDETRIPPSVAEIYRSGYTQAVGKAAALRRSVGLDAAPTIDRVPDLQARFREMLMEVPIVNANAFMFRS